MSERIYTRDGNGAIVAKGEAREDGKTYRDIGRDPDGATRLYELTAADEAARAADEQRWAAKQATRPLKVDYATILERMRPEEYAKIGEAEARDARFKWWLERIRAQGKVNIRSPEFAGARQAVIDAGLFAAERFDELFAPAGLAP
jgi:hypothetical protein